MKKRIQCLSNASSICPSIINCFPVIQPVSSKVRHFSTFFIFSYFGLPGYASGTIAVNVTSVNRGFNACKMHRSIYPSIFNRFPVSQPVSSKVRQFSTFLHILSSLDIYDGTIAVNVSRMERGFNAHSSIIISIYLQPFTSYSEILVGIATFSYPLALGVFPLKFGEKVWYSEN